VLLGSLSVLLGSLPVLLGSLPVLLGSLLSLLARLSSRALKFSPHWPFFQEPENAMNIQSVGSSMQSSMENAQGATAGAVMSKVLDQEKIDGQDAIDLIDSAAQPSSSGSLSVYA